MVTPISNLENIATKENCLLVIIDVQEKLTPQIESIAAIIANITKLVKLSQILHVPIMLTQQQNLGEIVDEIKSALIAIEPITKLSFSCFGSLDFQQRVQSHRRSTLILVGIEAHICVAQTALDAAGNYNVHLVSDAIGSRSGHNRDIAIERMRQCGITITTTEMIIYELLKQAGTDEFRTVLPLLK
jgi:nicotinamidase-related amidase